MGNSQAVNWKLPNSRLGAEMQTVGIREIVAKANALEQAGKKIVHLEIGTPDYDSPALAKERAKKELDEGRVHYTDMSGTAELREAVAFARKRDYGMDVDPDKEVVITVGAMEALTATLLTVLEPGDEVIVPAPFFPAYSFQIALANGVLRKVPCRFENRFRPRVEDIEAVIGPRSRILLINSPNNPSGVGLSAEELSGVAELAKKHNLIVVSDECYEKFLYDGKHVSIADMPGMRERTIIISAASKTFSMTGWRIGWLITPPEARQFITKCHQHLTTCATSFAQAGAAEALRSAGDDVSRMIQGYKERRDTILSRLSAIDGFETCVPEGAFYVFPRISKLMAKLKMSTTEAAAWLLDKAGVAAVPGEAFHAEAGFLRMAYCRPLEEINAAMDGIESAVRSQLK